jgi:hypothetical protein
MVSTLNPRIMHLANGLVLIATIALAACTSLTETKVNEQLQASEDDTNWYFLLANRSNANSPAVPQTCPAEMAGRYKTEQLVFFETAYEFKCTNESFGTLHIGKADGDIFTTRSFTLNGQSYMEIYPGVGTTVKNSVWPQQPISIIVGYEATPRGIKVLRIGQVLALSNLQKKRRDADCVKRTLTRQKFSPATMGFCDYFALTTNDWPHALQTSADTPATDLIRQP